jgi:hypothetical protein
MEHASNVSTVNASSVTRALLAGGVVAGPVYVVVFARVLLTYRP